MGDHGHNDNNLFSLPTNGYNGHFGYVSSYKITLSSILTKIFLSLDAGDSCNGSKTQSATTTESNTPENTVRMDGIDGTNRLQQPKKYNFTIGDNGELILTDSESPSSRVSSVLNNKKFFGLVENLKESEIVKTAITLKVEDEGEFIVQALSNLSVCIKYGNGQVPSKNFKWVLIPSELEKEV